MISLAEYVGPWGRSPDWTSERKQNAIGLLSAVWKLMSLAMSDGIEFPINPVTHSSVSGQTLGGFRPQASPVGAPKSNHKQGLAVDLYDPHDLIDAWCMSHLDVLEQCGIWLESPTATPGWSHWQCVPPKSGRRVFLP
jgi:hypothetical protein